MVLRAPVRFLLGYSAQDGYTQCGVLTNGLDDGKQTRKVHKTWSLKVTTPR